MQAGGRRFDPVILHHFTVKLAKANQRVHLMSQVVFWFVFVRRLSSLKIYRVESVVDGKLIGGKGP